MDSLQNRHGLLVPSYDSYEGPSTRREVESLARQLLVDLPQPSLRRVCQVALSTAQSYPAVVGVLCCD